MLDLEILQNKKTFIKTNGDEVIDLTRRSISFKGVREGQGSLYVVEDEAVMRADLISKIAYQTRSFLCLLLKYNSISNPFSLNANDTLRIPDSNILSELKSDPIDLNGTNDNWQNSTRKKKRGTFITPKTKQDQARIDYLQKTNGTQIAPPNISKDESVKIIGGKIIFGADVTTIKKEDCPDPISRTKLQAALLKNKIA
jgi:hypothetical protein